MNLPLQLPLSADAVRGLKVGDAVLLSGVLVTARDTAHRWLMDSLISPPHGPSPEDEAALDILRPWLEGGIIYHCGPLVSELSPGQYRVLAAGPTTSLRVESHTPPLLRYFHLAGVMGKGGMGNNTLQALRDTPAVYLHAVGGAAVVLARAVREVLGVLKLEFGAPEALWLLRVVDFPAIVSMDSHGNSLHEEIRKNSAEILNKLVESQ